MKTMNCEEIRDLLPLYAGGELGPEERMAAEAHLSLCAECGRELDLYREDRVRLADAREDEPPPGVLKALREGIEAELFPRKASLGLLAARFAAALLLGLALGLAVHAGRRALPDVPSDPVASAPDGRPSSESVASGARAGALPAAGAPGLGAWPLRLRAEPMPRFHAPRATLDGRHYLPRVESFPPPGERDF